MSSFDLLRLVDFNLRPPHVVLIVLTEEVNVLIIISGRSSLKMYK